MTKNELEVRIGSIVCAINSALLATTQINDHGGNRTLGEVLSKYAEMAEEHDDLDYADGFNCLLVGLSEEALELVLRTPTLQEALESN